MNNSSLNIQYNIAIFWKLQAKGTKNKGKNYEKIDEKHYF